MSILVDLIGAAAIAAVPAGELPTVPYDAGWVQFDGRLEEEGWRRALRIDAAQFTERWSSGGEAEPPPSFNLRMFHDGVRLYVALASYDRFVERGADADDSDGLYAFSILAPDGRPRHYRLRFASARGEPAGSMLDTDWGARIRGPFDDPSREGGGYVIEFAIPLQSLGAAPGSEVAVNAIVQNHDANPGGSIRAPATRFGRYAWGTLDNDSAQGYRHLRLAPLPTSAVSSPPQMPPAPASDRR